MGFLNTLFGQNRDKKGETIYTIERSASLFTELLSKSGFSREWSDPKLGWKIFKEFSNNYHFDCNDDALLWEIGPYCYLPQGGRALQCHIVRQFICGAGEDDDIRQLCFDINFPEGVGEGLKAAVWSYDFGNDFKAFFDAVEARPDFIIAVSQTPKEFSVHMDEV